MSLTQAKMAKVTNIRPNARDTEEVNQMLRARQEGLSYAAIGCTYGISRQRIHQILSSPRDDYKEIVWKRAGGCCEVCGLSAGEQKRRLTYHHKELIVEGYNDPDNVLLVCDPCHRHLHIKVKTHKVTSKRKAAKVKIPKAKHGDLQMMRTTLFEKYIDGNLMTVGELAAKLGYSREYLSGIRNDRFPITESFVARVCYKFGVQEGDLFFNDGDDGSEKPDESSASGDGDDG